MRLVDASPVFGNGRAAVSLGVPADGGQSRDETEEARVRKAAMAIVREAEASERDRCYITAAIQYEAAANEINSSGLPLFHFLRTGEGTSFSAKAFVERAILLRRRDRVRTPKRGTPR